MNIITYYLKQNHKTLLETLENNLRLLNEHYSPLVNDECECIRYALAKKMFTRVKND